MNSLQFLPPKPGLTPQYRASIEHGLSWAVAGRSEGKLQAVLDRAGKAVAADLSSTPVIVSAMYPFPNKTKNWS